MSKEKVIEIKINDATYIVFEVNRNDDYLKQIIKDMLIALLVYWQYDNLIYNKIITEMLWSVKCHT